MRQRAYSVEINDKTIIDTTDISASANNITNVGVQLRMAADVTIDAMGNITYCDLNLYNLSETTINEAFKTGSTLSLRAGYEDNIDYIFSGIIRNVFRYRDGPTTITQIIARGGKLTKSKVNTSLGKNVKLSTIIQSLADAMGYPLIITKSEFTKEYTTGYSITGDAMESLAKLSSTEGFAWAIENESLVVYNQDTGRSPSTRLINMKNGLEGIPEVTEVGVDFTVRCDPTLKVGARIELDTTYKTFNFSNVYYPTSLQTAAGSGEYTIMKIKHSLDNYGGAWSTKCSGFKSSVVVIN